MSGTTIGNPGQLPVAVQSGDNFLLIANNNGPNNYWIWDGNLLYGPGTVGPFVPDNLTAAGAGYNTSDPPVATVFGGSGVGVVVTPTIINGSIVDLTVVNAGSGYVPADSQAQVAFTGGGTDSAAIITVALYEAQTISSLELINGGSGYTSAPTVTISGGGGGASGAAAVATVTNGIVTGLTVTNPGTGYAVTPTITFSGGGGNGASAIALLTGGGVVDPNSVDIINGGSGYQGTPTISLTGGGGTGATAVATMTNGVITGMTVTYGGTGYTSAPLVVVQGGLNNAATALLDVMPFGVSGTSIETFQTRVWIADPATIGPTYNGGVINTSAPGSITNFAASAGGNLFTNSDRFLEQVYNNLHQSNGYLYTFGDSSVSVISNVQTSGNPSTTTFNYQNTSDQIGVAWRDTVQDYGQSVLFGNANGVQGLYGGNVQRVSKKMNNIFNTAVFPPTTGAVTPSSAVANVFTIPVYLMNMTLKDPTQNGLQRTVMLGWNEKEWFIISQSSQLTFIGTQEIASKLTAWGTDGATLFPLLQIPSALIQKRLTTKLFGANTPYIIQTPMAQYVRATDHSTEQNGVSLTINMESAGLAQQIGGIGPTELPSYDVANVVQPNFLAPKYEYPVWGGEAVAVAGTALGMTVVSVSLDFVISDLVVAYRNTAAVFG